ncbi:MAG: thioredoxin domain-containing protein, partial [Bacteroidota bacterium]|nr:thioredoxin domain-containing protein [Bacteroidota bacterium]
DAGLFFTASDAESLIIRAKDAHDGALPSGNAAAAYNLVRLARLTGNPAYERRAEGILAAFGAQIERSPTGHSVLLATLDLLRAESVEIVLVGPTRASVAPFARALRARGLPHGVMLYRGAEDDQAVQLAPFTAAFAPIDGEAAAYVCRGFRCELPVTSVDAMMALIETP